MKFYVKKGAALLALVGVGVAYGANPCSNSNFTAILSKNAGSGCTAQAAQSAISCLQNTCLQGALQLSAPLSSSQLNCFSESCAGPVCALSNNQVSTDFMNQYNTQAQKCKQVAGQLNAQSLLQWLGQNTTAPYPEWTSASGNGPLTSSGMPYLQVFLLLLADFMSGNINGTFAISFDGKSTLFGYAVITTYLFQGIYTYIGCSQKSGFSQQCLINDYRYPSNIAQSFANVSSLSSFLNVYLKYVYNYNNGALTKANLSLASFNPFLATPAAEQIFAYLLQATTTAPSASTQQALVNFLNTISVSELQELAPGTGFESDVNKIIQKANSLGLLKAS